MKSLLKRLTYANVMSSIAVFLVVAGGTAFAANQLGKNTVGSKQLKKNAVTAAKIKKEAVTGAKVKKGSLTGSDINVGTLGKVPSASNADHAASADSATSATNATNAVNAANWNRYGTSGLKAANVGTTIALATIGPFTIKGTCSQSGADFVAKESIETSQSGSFLYSPQAGGYYDADFEAGEPKEIGESVTSETPEWYEYYDDDETGWTAANPSGSLILTGWAREGVHVFGGDCAFDVSWINNA